MTSEQAKAFELWLAKAYQQDNSVPSQIVEEVLRIIRANAK